MKFHWLNLTHLKIQRFMSESVIVNWSNVSKGVLVLVLGALDHILWLAWYWFGYTHDVLHHWLSKSYFTGHLRYLIIVITVFIILILSCFLFKNNKFFQKYFPYVAVLYFGLTFIKGGYTIGIISPATIAGYISLISVGLVLFERRIIYFTFIPITIFLLIAIYLSATERIDYAPIFSEELKFSVLYKNDFWVSSMLFLYVPIFFASIVLFEILLIQWKNREKLFNEMSLIDPLTGIFNRRSIANHLKCIQEKNIHYSLILIDLDYFKNINDTYGHDAGDNVLKNVANILSQNLREEDLLGRFGGEEFILILNETNLTQAVAIAECCRQNLQKKPIVINRLHSIQVSASFGVAESLGDLSNEIIIHRADQALYFAKANGRNQVRYYQELEQRHPPHN